MTNEDLVARYNSGDVAALNELTIKNQKLIRFVANKYTIHCSFIDYDDLYQQGWIGFLRAIQTYRDDLPNSAKFSTWAIHWINQAINRHLKQRMPKGETSIYEPIADDITVEDTLEDPEALNELWKQIERRELREELEAAMKRILSLKEIEMLKLWSGWDNNIPWSFVELGKLYGVSGQGAREAHKRATRKIRRTPWGLKMRKEYLLEHRAKSEYRNTESTAVINIALRRIYGL